MTRAPFAAGVAVGALAGALARRWWHRRTRAGAMRSLRMGIAGVEEVGLALTQATSASLVGGNRLAWRHDREIFDALEEAIRDARRSLHVDLYIWKPGNPGARLADLVCRRARDDRLAVRVLVDPMGSTGFHEELCGPLRKAGCEVRYFRDPKRRPLTITGRNHRKLVVVDGRLGFTGGFGIAPEWNGDGRSPGAWRDANAEIEGPVVRQMQAAFANHWIETGGAFLPREELEPPPPAGRALAAYVTSTDVVGLSHARWVTYIALMAARRRAWIANAYFAPPPAVLGTLLSVGVKGVDVRLLLPGPHQDHPTVTWWQRRHYPRLARSGAAVFEYQPSMMHAKTMLVDDRLVVVGSINMDYLSMEWLEEGCLVADDETFAGELSDRWGEDLGRSRLVAGARPAGHARSAALEA